MWTSNFEHYRLKALLLGDATAFSNKSNSITLSYPSLKSAVAIVGANACDKIDVANRVINGVLSLRPTIVSIEFLSWLIKPL